MPKITGKYETIFIVNATHNGKGGNCTEKRNICRSRKCSFKCLYRCKQTHLQGCEGGDGCP